MNIVTKASLLKTKPRVGFKEGFDLRQHIKKGRNSNNDMVLEFIGTDDFASTWYARQRYEVLAGRDEEPLLYPAFYDTITDATLPRNVSVYQIGPAGVVFNEVKEGGEVQFVSVGQTNYSVPIKHYAVGLEYDKDLLMFNELWNVSIVERQVGTAHNAFLNNLHFSPITTATYGASNLTAASSTGSTVPEKYLRTIEDAITHSRADTTNPRRGPYALLVSTSNVYMMERALSPSPQLGFTLQSSAQGEIRSVIAYDGWTGLRGKKTTTYSGVAANTAYLVDLSGVSEYLRSFVKQPLESQLGEADMSRFIMSQIIWDTYLGVYASPTALIEKITLPTS